MEYPMDRPRLLITGASGLVGKALCSLATSKYEVLGQFLYNRPLLDDVTWYSCDLSQPGKPEHLMELARPDIVIHAAAQASPNTCEKDPDLSRTINHDVAVTLAEICARQGTEFLFLSTDLVFNGENAPYDESASPDPISVYGKHKAWAERDILEAHPMATICRLALVYETEGIHNNGNGNRQRSGVSFLTHMLHTIYTRKQPITLYTDEYRTPIWNMDAARGILQLVGSPGIFHLGGEERFSRYEFVQIVTSHLHISEDFLLQGSRFDAFLHAPRPADTSLTCEKARLKGFSTTPLRTVLEQHS